MLLNIIPAALVASFYLAAASPSGTRQELELADPTGPEAGTISRVTRASPYHKSYESEGDGEIGYSRKKSGGGKKGYQHFDTYHKKAGDNYEFEKQDSFGLDNGGKKGTHAANKKQKAAKYQEVPSSEGEHYYSSGEASEGGGGEGDYSPSAYYGSAESYY